MTEVDPQRPFVRDCMSVRFEIGKRALGGKAIETELGQPPSSLSASMVGSFDSVTVGVQQERAIIGFMVVRLEASLACTSICT